MQQVLKVVISSFTLIPYDFWGMLGEAINPFYLLPFYQPSCFL